MVTLEELKETFVVADTPYGKCVVVPARMFGAAWEEDLKKQGCKIFSTSSDGQAAFFIKPPNSEKPQKEPRMVYEPPTSKRGAHLGRRWTKKEDKRIIELFEQQPQLTVKEIAEKIPDRTENSVRCRITRLQKRGLLPKRRTPSTPAATDDGPKENEVDKVDKGDEGGLVKEFLEASAQLYPKYRHASALLLREAAKHMETEG